MKNRKWQQQYIKMCIPAGYTFSIDINNKIVVNINEIRLVSSSLEEMREKIKIALNK